MKKKKTPYQQAVENLLNKKVKRPAKSIRTILFSEEGLELKDFIIQVFLKIKAANLIRSTNPKRSLRDRRLDAISRIIMGDETCSAFAILPDRVLVATNTNEHDRVVLDYKIEFDMDPNNIKDDPKSPSGLAIDVWCTLFANFKSEKSYNSLIKNRSEQESMRCVKISQKYGPFRFFYKEEMIKNSNGREEWRYFIDSQGSQLRFRIDAPQHKKELDLNLNKYQNFEIVCELRNGWVGPIKMHWENKKGFDHYHRYKWIKKRVFDQPKLVLPGFKSEFEGLHRWISGLFFYLSLMQPIIFIENFLSLDDFHELWQSRLAGLLKDSFKKELQSQLRNKTRNERDIEQLDLFIEEIVEKFHKLRNKKIIFISSKIIKKFLRGDDFKKHLLKFEDGLIIKNNGFGDIFLSLLERYLIDIEKLSNWARYLPKEDPMMNLIAPFTNPLEQDPKNFPIDIIDDLDEGGHAEMRILNYLLAKGIDPQKLVYLSIAKLSCALCHYTLQRFDIDKIPGNHSAIFSRWRLPDVIKNDEAFLKLFLDEDLYEQYQKLDEDHRKLAILIIESLADLNNPSMLERLGLVDTAPIGLTKSRKDQFPDESDDESLGDEPVKELSLQDSERINRKVDPHIFIKQKSHPAIAPGILLASDGLSDLTLEITVNFFNPSREKSVEKDLNVKELDYQL